MLSFYNAEFAILNYNTERVAIILSEIYVSMAQSVQTYTLSYRLKKRLAIL